jgi:hypothetical protein
MLVRYLGDYRTEDSATQIRVWGWCHQHLLLYVVSHLI